MNNTNIKLPDTSYSIFNIETINELNRAIQKDGSIVIKDSNGDFILIFDPKIIYEVDKSYKSFTFVKSVHVTGKVFNKNKLEDYIVDITNNEKDKNIASLFLLSNHNDIKL